MFSVKAIYRQTMKKWNKNFGNQLFFTYLALKLAPLNIQKPICIGNAPGNGTNNTALIFFRSSIFTPNAFITNASFIQVSKLVDIIT